MCKSEQRTILTASTIDGWTERKSDTDQRGWANLVGTIHPLAAILTRTFSLTRGALHAEETRPFFLYVQIFFSRKGHSRLPEGIPAEAIVTLLTAARHSI
jgi:hypothetical protein